MAAPSWIFIFSLVYLPSLLGVEAVSWGPRVNALQDPEYVSVIRAQEAAARRARVARAHLRENRVSPHSMIQHPTERAQSAPPAKGFIPQLGVLPEDRWSYKEHGADWTEGKCRTGTRQSPVDLHIEGLTEPQHKNLTELYLGAFSGGQFAGLNGSRLWKKGDFFYTYPNQLTNILVYKSDKVFQLRSAGEGLVPLGALFGTDTAEMFVAHQILFHSPSEHTFQGEANRREIEMQIWHYSNDLLSAEASKSVDLATLPYMALFAQSSLSLPDVDRAIAENARKAKDPDLPSSHWRVISLTFMSEELDQATLEDLRGLPSERLLRTLLVADGMEKEKLGQAHEVELSHPLNLQSLMMMLQLTNLEFFAYDGSHSMPGCEENVRWYVARQPLPVATDTMLRFYKMLNPGRLKHLREKDGNFRRLQNVRGNMKNGGNAYLVQGYPLQLLIADSLGFTNMSDQAEVGASTFQGWFQGSSGSTYRWWNMLTIGLPLALGLGLLV